MKSAIIILILLSSIFSKIEYQSDDNEPINVTATNIKYPSCSSFPKNTKFDIEYNKTDKVMGNATFKLSLNEVNVNCVFTEEKGSCETQDDVKGEGDLYIQGDIIEVSNNGTPNANINITDVNKKANYNKDYIDLSDDVNDNQTFFFNDTNKDKFEHFIKIKFNQDIKKELNVYKGKDENKTELKNCSLADNKTEQCVVSLDEFPLDSSNNATLKTYEVYVENACKNLYEKKIKVNVKWGSSHYVKAFGLLSILLVFIL